MRRLCELSVEHEQFLYQTRIPLELHDIASPVQGLV